MHEIIASGMPYVGLFGIAFLAATIVPAQSELAVGAMLLSGRYDTALVLISATAGNTFGAVTNWLLGRFAERFRDRPWFPIGPASLTKATGWYSKWGKWSLLLSWAPIIGDALTVAAGLLRAPFPKGTLRPSSALSLRKLNVESLTSSRNRNRSHSGLESPDGAARLNSERRCAVHRVIGTSRFCPVGAI